jgi:hypothetical protein
VQRLPLARVAIPGWLGPYTAEKWLNAAHGEGAIACHQTIPDGGGWGDDTRQCQGAAIFRANVCKSPRNPTVADAPQDKATVFASNVEFIAHHTAVDASSIEADPMAAQRRGE